jgi:hypothetical protein
MSWRSFSQPHAQVGPTLTGSECAWMRAGSEFAGLGQVDPVR